MPLLLFAVAITVNPIGFIGGDADDLQYLQAARCWRDFGPCLPHDHWQGRWPIIAPLALAIGIFGEARWSVALPSLAASIACLFLTFHLGRQLFNDRAGALAASIVAVMPVFAIQALDPNVDVLELAFILAGFALMMRGRTDDRWIWPMLCGLSFGMALQVRETALAAAPMALIAFAAVYPMRRGGGRAWLLTTVGFALPFVVELLLFAFQTGDPLWRRRLSLQHTELATTELRGRSSVEGLPFFNRELIANWRHEPGLSIHWAVDGLANLVVNPRTAAIFMLFPLLLVQARHRLTRVGQRRLAFLALFAVAQASTLIYVFAIDPKPRMMMPALLAMALASAPLMLILWQQRPAFAWMLSMGIAMICILNIASGYRSSTGDKVAAEWIMRYGDQSETVRQTRKRLIFIPEARRLADAGSGRPLLLVQVNNSCASWLDDIGIDRSWFAIEEEASLGSFPATWIARQAHFCLFRYRDPRALPALRMALGSTEFEAAIPARN